MGIYLSLSNLTTLWKKIKSYVTGETAKLLNSPTFTGTPKAPTAASGTNTTQLATTAFVQEAVNSKIAAADAMRYKGTLGTGGTATSLPATHAVGDTYKVIAAGTYAGQKCEVGDMVICLTAGSTDKAEDWTVIQANVDGAVTGPDTSVDSHVAVFSGTTGKVIEDSGFTIAKSVPADAKFTDTVYTHPAGSAASKAAGLYKISTDANSHVKSATAVTKADIVALGLHDGSKASGSADGLMSKEDFSKLAAIEAKATCDRAMTDEEIDEAIAATEEAA